MVLPPGACAYEVSLEEAGPKPMPEALTGRERLGRGHGGGPPRWWQRLEGRSPMPGVAGSHEEPDEAGTTLPRPWFWTSGLTTGRGYIFVVCQLYFS